MMGMVKASQDKGTLTVAVSQFAPSDDRADNRRRIGEQVADAAQRGAQLVVFPEYSSYFVPEMDETLAENAENLDGEFVASLQQLAAEHEITIVAGMLEAGTQTLVRNTAVAVDATGLLAVYRKQHLYDAFGFVESDWVEPGNLETPQTFSLAGFTLGLMTCYDLRFPEVARTLIDAGVDVIVIPSDWIRGPLKEHNWQTLLMARAIENTAYVVAADHPTPTGIGHSMVVDPQGMPIAAAGVSERLVTARLERLELARVRKINPALELRRYRVLPN
jgi:predicted amidohydrolase